MKKSIIISAIICCSLLTACGLKGNLELEKEMEEYDNVNNNIF